MVDAVLLTGAHGSQWSEAQAVASFLAGTGGFQYQQHLVGMHVGPQMDAAFGYEQVGRGFGVVQIQPHRTARQKLAHWPQQKIPDGQARVPGGKALLRAVAVVFVVSTANVNAHRIAVQRHVKHGPKKAVAQKRPVGPGCGQASLPHHVLLP